REVEPYNYNTSSSYRTMVTRLVGEAENAVPTPHPILILVNTGINGSHDPMTTLPGAGAPVAAAALRQLLARHPTVRLSLELYCSGAMSASAWHARPVHLANWAQAVAIDRHRITVNEDISNTTASSGESYGTLGQPDAFNRLLLLQAADARNIGFGGVD